MIKVGVIGATGYTGAELVRILSGHPEAELAVLTSRQHPGRDYHQLFPAFKGLVDLKLEPCSLSSISSRADVFFTALPHKLPMEIVPDLLREGKKVVDLSADFRFKDAAAYESHYQAHTAKDLLTTAVYGLSEIYTDDIRQANLVGNPGCYPTCALLPLIPLIKEGVIDSETLIIDAKSGASGAGRGLALTTHFCELTETFKAYKVAGHRHTPEIEAILSQEAGQPVNLTFVPHLIPMSRGMLATTYASLRQKIDTRAVLDCLRSYYQGRKFIRVLTEHELPDTRHVRGTNFCEIGCRVESRNNRLILISAIDNLVKGASGQAVQNMNLMLGLDEAMGLNQAPYPL